MFAIVAHTSVKLSILQIRPPFFPGDIEALCFPGRFILENVPSISEFTNTTPQLGNSKKLLILSVNLSARIVGNPIIRGILLSIILQEKSIKSFLLVTSFKYNIRINIIPSALTLISRLPIPLLTKS